MDPIVQRAFNEDVLTEAASRYEVRRQDLSLLGGFENFVYEFHRKSGAGGGGGYVMRFSHDSHRTWEMIEGEVEWINYLAEHGLRVARAVPSFAGKLVEAIPAEVGVFLVTVFEKAPGGSPPDKIWGPELFQKMGSFMGQMHHLTRGFIPSEPRFRRLDFYSEAKGFAAKNLPASEQEVIERFDANLEYLRGLPVEPDNFGMVHTDFHGGNFFVHEGEITLFDFDDCQYSWFVDDIALSLFYAVPETGKPRAIARAGEVFLENFLRGYRQHYTLDPAWFAQVPYFHKTREMAVYAVVYAHTEGDFDKLRGWGRRFMQGRREKILKNQLYVDLDFVKIAERCLA